MVWEWLRGVRSSRSSLLNAWVSCAWETIVQVSLLVKRADWAVPSEENKRRSHWQHHNPLEGSTVCATSCKWERSSEIIRCPGLWLMVQITRLLPSLTNAKRQVLFSFSKLVSWEQRKGLDGGYAPKGEMDKRGYLKVGMRCKVRSQKFQVPQGYSILLMAVLMF